LHVIKYLPETKKFGFVNYVFFKDKCSETRKVTSKLDKIHKGNVLSISKFQHVNDMMQYDKI
jgi:hypothetical protein